jgi:hypothetical protein
LGNGTLIPHSSSSNQLSKESPLMEEVFYWCCHLFSWVSLPQFYHFWFYWNYVGTDGTSRQNKFMEYENLLTKARIRFGHQSWNLDNSWQLNYVEGFSQSVRLVEVMLHYYLQLHFFKVCWELDGEL